MRRELKVRAGKVHRGRSKQALIDAEIDQDLRYYQLKVGHGAIGTFLTRIGVIESPECWWCGVTEQSVEHLYTKCRR